MCLLCTCLHFARESCHFVCRWRSEKKESVERKKDFSTFLCDCNCSNIKNREWISRCLGLVWSVKRKRERNEEEKREKNKFTVWCCPWKMVLPNIFIRLEIILLPRKNLKKKKKFCCQQISEAFLSYLFCFGNFGIILTRFWGFTLHLL